MENALQRVLHKVIVRGFGRNFGLLGSKPERARIAVKTIESPDGKKRVSIVKSRVGNLFSFEEETHTTDEDGYTYWSPSYGSGFYDSAEAAERDARLELPWLRDKTPN